MSEEQKLIDEVIEEYEHKIRILQGCIWALRSSDFLDQFKEHQLKKKDSEEARR